ncbi:MAG TPA: Holliday junction resolvase RuvX [Bacteroidota bacterium]|nr:Holliday junction resolvase RuvX [Bacteroidota bacterium]
MKTQAEKRVLGIDFGSVKIGVAVSDPLRIIAQGLVTLPNDRNIVEKIGSLVVEHEVGLIVVGMPFTLKGEKGVKAKEVDAFVERLKGALDVDVVTLDERFTSRIAEQTLRSMGTTRKQRANKARIDTMASALILQSFLDRTKHSVGC